MSYQCFAVVFTVLISSSFAKLLIGEMCVPFEFIMLARMLLSSEKLQSQLLPDVLL